MIKSMTGFGSSSFDDGAVQLSVEIKSLNSKFLDLSLRLPRGFADREMELRNLISERLERGKVSVAIEFQRTGDASLKQSYNEDLFKSYYAELKRLAENVGDTKADIFHLALNAPEVVKGSVQEKGNEEDWDLVKKYFLEAVEKCDQFRLQEGEVLGNMLLSCVSIIRENLSAVEVLDPKRVTRVRERLKGNITSFFGEEGFDMNRLEQEIIFYIEKLDINEEKVRLKSHLDYFQKSLAEKNSNGKKLAFISQEMGREINTIGSKANDAEVQRHVVIMKEELEKIKEQLNNVL
jgi:uncharacterized protein (TIGR00255 family)